MLRRLVKLDKILYSSVKTRKKERLNFLEEKMFLESVPPTEERLQLSDTFVFLCHQDLECFNSCCRNKHLPLTPYDVLRLKTGLNISSDDFLIQYTVYRLDPDSGFPVVSLGMTDAPGKPCPFVSRDGCQVYHHRPTACRLYPLGRAAGRPSEEADWEGFFYLLRAPGCLGSREKKNGRSSIGWKTRGSCPISR